MSTTNRDKLLKLLTLLRPALSTQNYIPALTHFAFADGWVMAFNDITAICAKCPVELSGCIPGETLLRALGSFNAENVSLKADPKDENLLVSSGRSKLKLPTMELDKFPYEEPSGSGDEIDLTDGILEGIRRCLFSAGSDPTHPATMGLTLAVDDDGRAIIFSTDNFTISRYQTKDKIALPGDSPVLLPTFFCEQLLTLGKHFSEEEIVLKIYAGRLTASFGKLAELSTRTLADTETLDFDKILAKHVTLAKLKGQLTTIPPSLDAAFSRAALVLSSEDDRATQISVEKGTISLLSKSALGESDDEIAWEGKPMDKDFYVDPVLVMRAIKACGSVAFMPKSMILADDSATFVHLISHSSI